MFEKAEVLIDLLKYVLRGDTTGNIRREMLYPYVKKSTNMPLGEVCFGYILFPDNNLIFFFDFYSKTPKQNIEGFFAGKKGTFIIAMEDVKTGYIVPLYLDKGLEKGYKLIILDKDYYEHLSFIEDASYLIWMMENTSKAILGEELQLSPEITYRSVLKKLFVGELLK